MYLVEVHTMSYDGGLVEDHPVQEFRADTFKAIGEYMDKHYDMNGLTFIEGENCLCDAKGYVEHMLYVYKLERVELTKEHESMVSVNA